MPHWTHLAFEFSIFVLFGVCFYQAWHSGRRQWFTLLGALAFGLIAEAIGASPRTVGVHPINFWFSPEASEPKQFGYYYNDFVFMAFGDAIPVCVGAGWAIILYTAYRTVLRLGEIPPLWRPFLAASLALTLDLIMEPVASNLVDGPGDVRMDLRKGLGMWFWFDNEGSGHYHVFDKVPLPNFVG